MYGGKKGKGGWRQESTKRAGRMTGKGLLLGLGMSREGSMFGAVQDCMRMEEWQVGQGRLLLARIGRLPRASQRSRVVLGRLRMRMRNRVDPLVVIELLLLLLRRV